MAVPSRKCVHKSRIMHPGGRFAMQYFWDWAVRPLLVDRRARHVLEIGASFGGNTDRIVRHLPDVRVSVIDPCLDMDLVRKYSDVGSVTVHAGRSLEVLPSLQGPYDAVLIDGDHNYYTVLNELRLIADRPLLASGGMILLHDIRRPWARADMYYEPERIPAAAKSEAAPHGVLTAVEQFLRDSTRPWMWLRWNTEHGLCALIDRSSGGSELPLRVKTFLWRSIRWRNRLLRWSGLRPADTILWGKEA